MYRNRGCPEGLGRPAPDLDQDRALQDIGGLDARVRVAGHAIVRRNLRGCGHFRKARQEIDCLQRHSLDGRLLRNGQDDEDRRDERGKDEHLFEHGYPLLHVPTARMHAFMISRFNDPAQ